MARAANTHQSGGGAVIGKETQIRGRVSGDGDLRIEGSVHGDLSLRGDLVVAGGAEVSGDAVQATSLVVEGTVEADITATEGVTIRASAKVHGAIKGARISIEEGASVSGRIEADFELPAELVGKPGR
jgi:cytoskeletal protein CcmA (bactofilin family)